MGTLEERAIAWMTHEEAADWRLFLGLRLHHLVALSAYGIVVTIDFPGPWNWLASVGGMLLGQIVLMMKIRREWRLLPDAKRRRIVAALATN